jgi:hypothetical protein
MRLLELFCGTKSVSHAVGANYTEVVSVDILPRFAPTICTNIMDWDYTVYPPGHFDDIWASPPCTQYSKAKTRGVRDLAGANAIVARTLEIIRYFNPVRWYMENPETGLLKDQEVVRGLPYIVFDYCRFGLSYRKRTAIWTNQTVDSFRCLGAGRCRSMVGERHRNSCGNGNTEYSDETIGLHQKYSVPGVLVRLLFGLYAPALLNVPQ